MKRLFATAILLVIAFGAVQLFTATPAAARTGCTGVKCLPCPDGYINSPSPGNCCRCVPIK